MKKWFSLLLIFIGAFVLMACSDDDNGDTIPVRNIVLSYADWGDQELNQRLIDAFMLEYPNITVELRQDITGAGAAFTESLLNAQAGDVLPEVFAIDNVPTGYDNGMLLDISAFWDADPDTALVYPEVAQTAIYGSGRYGIPSFQFIKGIYINLTLLDFYNVPIPPKDWHYNDFIALAEQIRVLGENDMVYAIDPWFGDLDFETTFPMLDDETIGYNTWDGERFNFTNPAWIDAYDTKLDLWARGIPASHTEEELAEIGDVWPWLAGYTAMSIDGSWNLWMIDTMLEEYGFDVGFWPYPRGDAGQFPPTILDFIVVSSQAEHPEEAYLLAKWMTFGKQGWLTRLDLMEERGDLYLDRYPIAEYDEVWARAEIFIDYVEGLRESIELLDQARPDVDKWLPGYKAFWEWVGNEDNNYWERIANNEVTPDTFASEWEERLNQMVQEAMQN